jgi:transposase-like protein
MDANQNNEDVPRGIKTRELTDTERGNVIAMLIGMAINRVLPLVLPRGSFTAVAKKFNCHADTIARLWKKADSARNEGVINSPEFRSCAKKRGRKRKNCVVTETTKKLQKSCDAIFEREVSKAQHHMEESIERAMKKMRMSLDSMLETGKLQSQLAKHSGARLDNEMERVKQFIDTTLSVEVSLMQRSFDTVLDREIKEMQTSLAKKLQESTI